MFFHRKCFEIPNFHDSPMLIIAVRMPRNSSRRGMSDCVEKKNVNAITTTKKSSPFHRALYLFVSIFIVF